MAISIHDFSNDILLCVPRGDRDKHVELRASLFHPPAQLRPTFEASAYSKQPLQVRSVSGAEDGAGHADN